MKETSGTALSQFLPDAFAAHILILKCLQRGEKVSAIWIKFCVLNFHSFLSYFLSREKRTEK